MNRSIKKNATKLVLYQLGIIVGLDLGIFLLIGTDSARSFLLGGLTYWLPTALFACVIFTRVDARAIKRLFYTFFVGEFIKLFLSGFLFIGVVKYFSVSALFALIGFCVAIIAFWIVSSLFFATQRENTYAK